MQWRKAKKPKELDAGTDTLNRLLDSELLIASRLAAAQAEADQLIKEAKEYSIRVEAACETTIGERMAHLAASYEAEFEREVQLIQSEAVSEVVHFDAADPGRIEVLAGRLLEAIGAANPTTRAVG